MAKDQTYVSFMGSDAAAKEENEKMEKTTSKSDVVQAVT